MSSYYDGRYECYHLSKVAKTLNSGHQRQVIDKDLNIINKFGVYWCVLCLLRPFYALFGYDIFSHVRVDAVARKVLETSKRAKEFLKTKPVLVEMIKTDVLDALNRRSKDKYRNEIDAIKNQLDEYKPPLPEGYLGHIFLPFGPDNQQIDFDQMGALNSCFDQVLPRLRQEPFRYSLEFDKSGPKGSRVRKLILTDYRNWKAERIKIEEFSVPLSIFLSYSKSGLIESFVLLTKEKIAEGGQTRVRLCFDLLKGERIIRKNYTDTRVHEFILKSLFSSSPSRGIVPVVNMRRIAKKNQVFEPCYDLTLSQFLGKIQLPVAVKYGLIEDLLCGLYSLHNMDHEELFYQNSNSFLSYYLRRSTGFIPICHFDLKPENILIRRAGEKWEASITDFGFSNPLFWGGTFGYKSPERVHFEYSELASISRARSFWSLSEPSFVGIEKVVTFKNKNGRPSDVWAMGLIFSMILLGRGSVKGSHFPPLRFFEGALEKLLRSKWKDSNKECIIEEGIRRVKQDEIDLSIEAMAKEATAYIDEDEQNRISELCKLVGEMLKVDPKERISALLAYSRFRNIMWQEI